MPVYHQVREGDCIDSIAFDYGFFPDTIWNDENNEALRDLRKDRSVLLPGDVVFVPDKVPKQVSGSTDQKHVYKRKGIPKTIEIQLFLQGKPRPNLKYRLEIDGKLKAGTTDEDGWVRQKIAPNAQHGRLILNDGIVYELNLGYLDPIDQISGVQGRLRNLGLYLGEIDGEENEDLTRALILFQAGQGLDATGELTDATRDALKAAALS